MSGFRYHRLCFADSSIADLSNDFVAVVVAAAASAPAAVVDVTFERHLLWHYG